MSYDEHLVGRLRELLADQEGITDKKMFGGLAFLLHGHMSVGASHKGRPPGPDRTGSADLALRRPHAAPKQMGGRRGRGLDQCRPRGLRTKRQLASWVQGLRYAATLPPK